MKPILIDRISIPDSSFAAYEHNLPHFNYPIHFHPQFEITYIVNGTGTQYIGNTISQFQSGDIILVGRNTPHYWQNDTPKEEEKSRKNVRALAVKFTEDFAGEDFINMPESRRIKEMLNQASHGLSIKTEEAKILITNNMEQLLVAKGFKRVLLLLEILHEISKENSTEKISISDTLTIKDREVEKLTTIINYISSSFQSTVSLEDIAAKVNMNPSSFCKYFKRHYHKTFIQTVNDMRIGYACKLMREADHNITEACYDSGFNNFSNFSRCFKKQLNMTPSEYITKLKQE